MMAGKNQAALAECAQTKVIFPFNDILSDRKQKVVIRNCSSSLRRVNAGVPQGSVLGPLLFF